MEKSPKALQKITNKTTTWSSNPTSGCIAKGNGNRIQNKHLYSHVYYMIIHSSQDMKTTQVSVNGWTNKDVSIYVRMHIYIYMYMYMLYIYNSSIRKTEVLPFATTWMDLEIISPSEVSHTEKDKYCMLCGI